MLSVEDPISKADSARDSNERAPGLAGLTVEEKQQLFIRNVDSFGGKGVFVNLVILNLIFHYVRPQDFIPGLGALKLPIIFLCVVGIAWAARLSCGNWTFQIKMMLGFIAFEGARSFIGKFVIDELVLNDFNSVTVWIDLFTISFGIVFPIVAFFDRGPALRRLLKSLAWIGMFLGLWSITHSGTGPGSFLGDENDMGCALLMLLAFSLAMLTEGGKSAGNRLLFVGASILLFGGILVTFSRGTFIGLVAMAGILLLRSRKKVTLIFAGAFVVLLAIPFAPPGYIKEMYTIQETNTGTADMRKHYWLLARRCFLDPHNTLFGVGLKNAPYHMGDYETSEDLQKYPSASGRATHSIYFEILPDLGIWGVLVVGSLLYVSIRGNRRTGKQLEKLSRRSRSTLALLLKQSEDVGHSTDDEPAVGIDSKLQSRQYSYRMLQRIGVEAQYVTALTTGTTVSLVGVLGSGAFIDILYYPHIWILFGISSLLEVYGARVLFLSDAIVADLSPPELGIQ